MEWNGMAGCEIKLEATAKMGRQMGNWALLWRCDGYDGCDSACPPTYLT